MTDRVNAVYEEGSSQPCKYAGRCSSREECGYKNSSEQERAEECWRYVVKQEREKNPFREVLCCPTRK